MRFYQAQFPGPDWGELRVTVEEAKQDILDSGYTIDDLVEERGLWYSPSQLVGIALVIV